MKTTKRGKLLMLACAALAAVFTVSAMAAYHLWGPGELFDPFFTLESAPLNGGQKELLDQIGATDLPPVTSNGVTLTPLAAVATSTPSTSACGWRPRRAPSCPTWGSRRITSPTMWSWSTRTPGSGSTGACRRPASSRTTPRGTLPGAGVHASGRTKRGQLGGRHLQDPDHHRPDSLPPGAGGCREDVSGGGVELLPGLLLPGKGGGDQHHRGRPMG